MNSLAYEEALKKLLEVVIPTNKIDIVPFEKSLGRVISEDVTAYRDLPPYNNSALDGYAIKYSERKERLKINKTTIFAGVTVNASLEKNECYKIMTGAKIPDGADTIARAEDVEIDGEFVIIPQNIKENDGFRVKGEEVKCGELLIKKGTRLNASHIALLASQGINQAKIKARPKICIVSSGNELKEPYEKASDNELYNINSYAMTALLLEFGFESQYGGIIPDDLTLSTRFFANMKDYDVLISSGGVSVGEADFTKEALERNGFKAIFESIKLKPGKPTTCGVMGKTLVLSMPGNPLAAIINTFLFALPALKKMEGENEFLHKIIEAVNLQSFKTKGDRANVVLGVFENGKFSVIDGGKISSGQIFPFSKSNAISIIKQEKQQVENGEKISVYKLF